jgi:predicted amidophosphoribosyltransferase
MPEELPKFCSNCGRRYAFTKWNFCKICGFKLSESDEKDMDKLRRWYDKDSIFWRADDYGNFDIYDAMYNEMILKYPIKNGEEGS